MMFIPFAFVLFTAAMGEDCAEFGAGMDFCCIDGMVTPGADGPPPFAAACCNNGGAQRCADICPNADPPPAECGQPEIALWARSSGAKAAATQPTYELRLDDTGPKKSKTTLAVIYLFSLNICGIDRCFMGQCCVGTLKGLTLGGLGIWALIDLVIVTLNMLNKKDSIDTFGFHAEFLEETIHTAYIVTLVGLVLNVLQWVCGGKGASQGREIYEKSKKVGPAAELLLEA
jgi:hypothetical protein